MMNPLAEPFGDGAAQHQRDDHRANDAGKVEAEQDQPLQAHQRRRCAVFGITAAITTA